MNDEEILDTSEAVLDMEEYENQANQDILNCCGLTVCVFLILAFLGCILKTLYYLYQIFFRGMECDDLCTITVVFGSIFMFIILIALIVIVFNLIGKSLAKYRMERYLRDRVKC